MKKFFSSIWTMLKTGASRTGSFVTHHKIASGVIVLILAGGGYWGYTALAAGSASTQYVLASVTQAPLNVTVTASGQVDAQDTLNLTPQASGQITYLGVTPGETVKAGTLVAELDMTTAAEAVTSAKQDLESAQISYQQTLSSSGTSVTNDQTSLGTAQTNNLTALATTYAALPAVMTGLDSTLHDLSSVTSHTTEENTDAYESMVDTSQAHIYHDQVATDYTAASEAYQNTQTEYANSDLSNLTPEQIEQLDQDTEKTDTLIETALKDSILYYNYINEQLTSAKSVLPTQISSQLTSLNSYQSTVTSNDTSISNAQQSLVNSQQSISQDTQSLGDNGTPLNVQSAELSVQKAQEALTEAETNEADYEVRAPFDGVIATVPVNKYDQASSGTTVATLITTEEYADLSLNETDAAKVMIGQPVAVTFDAIPNFTMQGAVATIDPVGTVTQGVVTYDVKISFATQDSRIKPGMTTEAVITTASEASAIQVPSAAVKTQGNNSYVEVATITNASSTLAKAGGATGARRTRTASSTSGFAGYAAGGGASTTGMYGGFGGASSTSSTSASTPMLSRSLTLPASEVTIKNVPVTVGISNDTMTEILTGLRPGQFVVTATQSASANTTKSAAASATSLLGGTTGRGGATGALGGSGGGYSGARTGGGAAPAATRGG